MALQEDGNSTVKYLMLSALNKMKRVTGFFTKKGFNKLITEVKPYKQKSMKKLIKKNKNQGIHIEKGLTLEEKNAILKDFKKYKMDYSVEKQKDGKFNIAVTSGNKSIMKELYSKYKINQSDEEKRKSKAKEKNKQQKPEKKTLKERIISSRDKAEKANEQRMHPVKHRDIGAR